MSLYKSLQDNSIYTYWQHHINSGKYVVNPLDNKIYIAGDYFEKVGINIDRPWIYTNNNPEAYCDWMHDIQKTFDYIPSHCLNCWKVVVKPNSLAQLMQLYALQLKMIEEDSQCYCKCGIETREHVFGNYGGYFYNRSYEAGLDKLELVENLVHNEIDKDISVYLKRYCTEFEIAYGPSQLYKQPIKAPHYEKLISDYFVMQEFHLVQSNETRMHIMNKWFEFAWDRGDKTVYMFTDGKPIYPNTTKYKRIDNNKSNESE